MLPPPMQPGQSRSRTRRSLSVTNRQFRRQSGGGINIRTIGGRTEARIDQHLARALPGVSATTQTVLFTHAPPSIASTRRRLASNARSFSLMRRSLYRRAFVLGWLPERPVMWPFATVAIFVV